MALDNIKKTTLLPRAMENASMILDHESLCAMGTWDANVGGKLHTALLANSETRISLLAGIESGAKALAPMLGPFTPARGDCPFGYSKDGYAVLETTQSPSDGATITALLAQSIFVETAKNVAAGCNPMDLYLGIQAAVDAVIEFLQNHKLQITSSEQIENFAIFTTGDVYMGKLIANAIEKAGKDGLVTVKESKSSNDELEVTEGVYIECGSSSPYFFTDIKMQKVEFEKPLFLFSAKTISRAQDILPALEISTRLDQPLVVFANVADDALSTCISNILCRSLRMAIVDITGFGDSSKSILGDIAAVTNGTVFTDEIKVEGATASSLGSSGSITITKNYTMVLNGGGSKEAVFQRCEEIRSVIADPTTSQNEHQKLQGRLKNLSRTVSIIQVGGNSDLEAGEKKDRLDHSLNAVRGAVEEGILPGGGTALIKACSQALSSVNLANLDQQSGVEVIKDAITCPARTIFENAGLDGSAIVAKLLDDFYNNFNMGFDCVSRKYVDMMLVGIWDPFPVVRACLVNASSILSMLDTSKSGGS
ncbi:hypothetical protein PMG11_11047 [Penicillium brasilianum]|uniref:Uncharacterized protein n=1 Tax=Penicillium brasilianum TaxID=104259 RepID=A0A0F7U4B5_PENBI|nr:hypothetical protein PMG11_11047 [Penicillium brasilianum]